MIIGLTDRKIPNGTKYTQIKYQKQQIRLKTLKINKKLAISIFIYYIVDRYLKKAGQYLTDFSSWGVGLISCISTVQVLPLFNFNETLNSFLEYMREVFSNEEV